MRRFAEDPQHAVLGMIDNLDDAAAVADAGVFIGFFDMQQDAVANAGGLPGLRFALNGNADFWRRAVRLFVPFVGGGERSPSLSRAVTSASTVEGRVPA